MSHAHFHAQSSARRFGGAPDDYLAIHQWFDATKEMWADARHRALRHHCQGIFECERQFGVTIPNSAGKDVPVRLIGEQHVMEDCGGIIPTIADWLSAIRFEPWMNFGYRRSLAVEHGDMAAPVPNARRANESPAGVIQSAPTARPSNAAPESSARDITRVRRRVATHASLEF
ncbi:hypothetical protein K9U39_20155 [Rhodoblastus acidophilus]|uniref:DUF6915 domain-containing protein n=1 Tax=Candidatus Rhodoblastus alkanivorans TaxID=2954117 RepID=A0ABS9ZBK0_9HYPH|nr:hypothetical protein [Candidatus Rhodoblastus alkanivorans]MCI4679093.1 hypothetical protein [Candidatus Rhodoblastus alkanivorans]MCI4685023.1 hypothetical protein [Candidatus Rhodoblastus alkanivorans]MDI4643209.1 hypothetical protein [Rhodoblastus acidophilus]